MTVLLTYDSQLILTKNPHIKGEYNKHEMLGESSLLAPLDPIKQSVTNYINHSEIFIHNDSDFLDQASKEGWSGLGTNESPIIISNYHFFNDSDNMVTIRDTTVHFRLINNSFDGNHSIWRCIYLVNVTNGEICNNILLETSGIGLFSCENMSIHDNLFDQNYWISVYLKSSNNNLIYNNTIIDGSFGIELDSSTKNQVINNTVLDVPWSVLLENSSFTNVSFNFINKDMICNDIVPDSYGISLEEAFNNSIEHNIISENCAGILVDKAVNNTIRNNILSENRYGIRLNGVSTNSNLLLENIINSNIYGIYTYISNNIIIKFNRIFNSTYHGIYCQNSSNLQIHSNLFLENHQYGLYLKTESNNSSIKWNDFLGNHIKPNSQAYDNGSQNFFDFNYWSTWLSPDINEDGIVDYPFTIDGMSGNSDQNPKVFVNHYHFLSPITFITPNGGEIFNNSISIEWQQVIDSYNHSLIYSIFYSPDNGMSWNLLANNLSTTYYEWNITEVSNGYDYLLKITALCSDGLYNEVLSNTTFSILNHILNIPTILSPKDGEIVSDYILVEWTEVTDSWNHDVTYDVFYSPDLGKHWILLNADLNVSYYDWDITGVENGFDYIIKVIARCSTNLTTTVQSNSTFTILNHVLSIPTVISPNGGEIISGNVTIQWEAVIDSWNHTVTYKVYYSLDGGISMHLLASNLSVTHLDWNTMSVDNGDHYTIKVYAFCSEGLSTKDISDNSFTINNPIDQFKTTTRKTSFAPLGLFLLPLILLVIRNRNSI